MAMVPGSSKVFDRETKELVACTKELCSDSYVNKGGEEVYYNMAPMQIGCLHEAVNSQASTSRQWAANQSLSYIASLITYTHAYTATPTFRLVSGLYGAVNSQASTSRQRAAYQFLSYISSPAVSGPFIAFNPISTAGPMYTEHLYDTPDNNFSVKRLWTQIGYNTNDTKYFLQSSRRILEHSNVMAELRIHRAPMHRESINKAADTFNTNPNASIAQVMKVNYQEMKSIIVASGPLKVVQKYYWDALKYTPDSPLPAPPAPTSQPPALNANEDSGFTKSQLATIIVITVLVALLIIVSATLVIRYYKNRKSINLCSAGYAVPPGDSPNTTLVVTDIESSTSLWEKLDATVMDSALTIHHTVIRETARKHRGYENGTEGDSFTIAFHTPRSAVLFAVECQAKFGPLASSDSAPQVIFPHSISKQATGTLSSIIGYARMSYKNLADLSHCTSPVKLGRDNTQSDLDAYRRQSTAATTEFVRMSDEPFSVPAPQPGGNRNNMDTMAIFDNHMTGLRVRMGIHAGVVDGSDVVRKKGRTRYTGGTLAAAKLVEEATQGAMVLLDESTKDILPIAGSDFEAVIGCMGAHKLKNDAIEYVNLYQAMAPHLVHRCVFLGPPKTLGAASPSFLEAPYGQAAIVFMKAVGAESLPPDFIEDALEIELMKYGGYLAEATLDGLLLAVFPEPLSAIRWLQMLAEWYEDF
eukprot:gene9225-16370_t